jgi:hypothetical protein
MNDRRSFFKGLAAFASGVVTAKITSYIPKKEEPKEKLMVSSVVTLKHGDKEYHPLVVEKTTYDGTELIPTDFSHSLAAQEYKPKIREANV